MSRAAAMPVMPSASARCARTGTCARRSRNRASSRSATATALGLVTVDSRCLRADSAKELYRVG